MISVKIVETNSELRDFIKFPDILYKGNKFRVTPLHSIEMGTLDKKKNPAFDYCESEYWLAYQNNKIVGRIAALINHKSNEIRNTKNARFGWIDFIDNYEISELLIKTAENWAKEKGMLHVHGPFGFTDLDLEGMLVDGFNEIGTQAVLYNYPYYPVHLEKLGYTKEADWLQFEMKVPDKVPEKIIRISNIVKEKYGLKVLKANKPKDILPYSKKMFKTLNESFENLHEFVPLTEKQIIAYTKQYFSLINPKYVCFVLDKDDDVVGFGISIFSLSKALIKAKGKLFPTGFIHILKALRKNDTVDMLLQGVKPQYQNKGIPSIFFAEMMQAYIDNNIKTAISSHALENNPAAYLMFQDFEHRQHLRRRSYCKNL
jgi:ribosomal protein S18 acetylase RimI-like enzyme